MEQVKNGAALDLLQAIASQTQLPRTGGKADGSSDFRTLMDKAAGSRDAKTEDTSKAETPGQGKTEEAPVQKQENSLERIKKLAEQGYAILQPELGVMTTINGEVYESGEYVMAWKGSSVEIIPITDLDEAGMQQLQQLLDNVYSLGTIDVSDPEADAMLEATDPTVDHSPAALLEKVTAEQFGKVVSDTVEAARPEKADADTEQGDSFAAEVIDAQQAPQPVFHDVKAVPVKVGEVDRAPEAEETNVVSQVDNGVAQAMAKGESMVRIQLNPENLGSVTVEITRSAEGIIRVALNAHSGETRSLLERHAGELQGLLGSRTQQNVEVSVQRQQESQQNHNHSYDGHNGHAQDGEHRQRRQQEQAGSQDFMQQLRLGLIPTDGENE